MMAAMGYRRFDEMIGQMQMLDKTEAVTHWKAKGLDFSRLFHKPPAPEGVAIYHSEKQDHPIHDVLDRRLIARATAALDRGAPVRIEETIRNTDRSAGAMLSGEVAKRYGHRGLPEDTIAVSLTGTGGQSFGAWLAAGVSLDLVGAANDYVGKGLSGGRLVVRPPENAGFVPEESIIVGNTVLYGAISGECYFRGVAGERFAVRNSGATAIVEGAGDHCCEYMTGGVVVVLGRTGRNFAAGMSGGIAYVLDEDDSFASRCNMSMVELEAVPEEDELLERLLHHGGDLEVPGKVDVMTDMTRFDAARLRRLITNHARYTASRRAAEILADWSGYLPKFKKVMPVEYRRALEELKAREEEAPRLAVAGE
jgi:glutamate synthase (NADPH/NADH) large chain